MLSTVAIRSKLFSFRASANVTLLVVVTPRVVVTLIYMWVNFRLLTENLSQSSPVKIAASFLKRISSTVILYMPLSPPGMFSLRGILQS